MRCGLLAWFSGGFKRRQEGIREIPPLSLHLVDISVVTLASRNKDHGKIFSSEATPFYYSGVDSVVRTPNFSPKASYSARPPMILMLANKNHNLRVLDMT